MQKSAVSSAANHRGFNAISILAQEIYNDATAKIYSDISYFTCDEALASDAVNFFNSITGYSQPQKYQKLEAAPISLRDKILDLIQHETERKKQGQKARIVAKVNSLVDPQIIDALYEASEAGVKIKLNIRGICCLRPGVSKLSKNIEGRQYHRSISGARPDFLFLSWWRRTGLYFQCRLDATEP